MLEACLGHDRALSDKELWVQRVAMWSELQSAEASATQRRNKPVALAWHGGSARSRAEPRASDQRVNS
jgi:hypothetical protein